MRGVTSPASSGAFSALLREQRYRRHFLVSDTKLTAVVMTVLGWAVVATVVNDVRLLRDRWTFWPVVLTKVGVAVYTSAMGLRLRRARWPRQADRILAWIFAVFVLAYCAIFPTRWGPAEVQGPIIGSSAISAIVYFALRGPVRPRAWVGSSIILVAIPLLWNPAAVVSPAARVTGTVAMVVVNVLGILGAYNAEQQRRRLFAAERHERLARQKLQENLRALAAAKERAEQSSRARTAFLAAMSHEFRTPMNAVINLSELLLDRGENEPLGEEGREHLRIVHDSARALLSQLNEILDFAQIDAQKLTLVPAPFHLPRLLASVTGMLRPAARARGLTLSLEAAPDLPVHVEADEARLRQVLVNLVSNAIKFTSKGSVRIQVRSQPVDDQRFDVSFAVKDTGIGLTKEAMSKLFRPFERIETGEKRAPGTVWASRSASKLWARWVGVSRWRASPLRARRSFSRFGSRRRRLCPSASAAPRWPRNHPDLLPFWWWTTTRSTASWPRRRWRASGTQPTRSRAVRRQSVRPSGRAMM